ncbi:DUF1330 domain-containing protein [Lentisalinibacter salinarum]|uniref:DUF1330 domain-containing protein n=1 Tax=Lentisalinibacter salinarum TaxID=2992239 RepID=UPI00386A952A
MSAYFVFNYSVKDQDAYKPYLDQVPKVLEAHGAEILAADFESERIEGDAGHVTVVLRFPSKAAAKEWYQSPEYQKIIGLRTSNSEGIAAIANAAGG